MTKSELREQFNRQAGRIRRLEEDLKALNAVVKIIERDMPVMLAYVDAGERYRFHNQAYRRWLGKSSEFINGRTMREVLGEDSYANIEDRIRQVLSGTGVRYDRSHASANGNVTQVCVHLVPRFNDQRAVAGFYSMIVDHAAKPVPAEVQSQPPEIGAPRLIAPLDPVEIAENTPELYDGAMGKAQAAWREAAERITSAIRDGEFSLYCQAIKDLAAEVSPFYAILVRQAEEEANMMPPGAFFALAEEYGMMSELDRWVVSGVLTWVSGCQRDNPGWRPSMYCINLSRDTISDPYFPEFVHERLSQAGVSAEALCFELQEADVVGLPADSADLMRNLRPTGARVMLGGFGRERISVEVLKALHFDFLKIDGAVVFNILRSEASLAKLRGIVRLAHTVGINTVAEMVESEQAVAKLRELEVDYAQGLAISAPLPLSALTLS